MPFPSLDKTNQKNLGLLIQLRWLAVSGQVITILLADIVLGISLPLLPLGTVILLLVALNLVSHLRHRSRSEVTHTELFIELMLDVSALTVQLYLTGGASNPFISLYLLQVALGAVLLQAWSTWALVILTSCCFIWLTTSYRPLVLQDGSHTLFALHIQGMFVCFVITAVLIVFFMARITRNLRARDAYLADLHRQGIEEDHIVRMGLLASGAAHELGTPLATLSVIMNDWRRMPKFAEDSELLEEVTEMQAQLDRCKAIVSGILMSSGEARGEGTVRTTVNSFFDEAVTEWQQHLGPARLDYQNLFGADEAMVSDLALKQVIFNVFDNALEASPAWIGVTLRREGAEHLSLTVVDKGPGFDPAILEEVGKPYRSSKNRPGSGLGLFLVVNVVRKLGGSLTARNGADGGARVVIVLPLEALSPGGEE